MKLDRTQILFKNKYRWRFSQMMKKLVLSAALALSFPVVASEGHEIHSHCDFSSYDGDPFKFLPLAASDRQRSKGNLGRVYRAWVEKDTRTRVSELENVERSGVILQNGDHLVRREGQSPSSEGSLVHYYEAITDRCESIYARVPEDHEVFGYYYDDLDARTNNVVRWADVGPALNVQFRETYSEAESLASHIITIIPSSKGHGLLYKAGGATEYGIIEPFAQLRVVAPKTGGFVFNGRLASSLEVDVTTPSGDKRMSIPWIDSQIVVGTIGTQDNIRKEFIVDIENQRLKDGMNASEVALAWGRPDRIKAIPVYAHPLTGRRSYGKNPGDWSEVGNIQEWEYHSRLEPEEAITFGMDGRLKGSFQGKLRPRRGNEAKLIH